MACPVSAQTFFEIVCVAKIMPGVMVRLVKV